MLASQGDDVVATTFGAHIAEIVGLRSEEEMIRSDAAGIVTAMADEKAIGDRTVRDLP